MPGNSRRYELAVILDADGRALIGEFDKSTGAVKNLTDATERLEREQEKADRSSVKLGKGMRTLRQGAAGAVRILGGMAGIISGVLGVSLGVGIARTIEWGNQLDTLSVRIGASTEGLSEYAFVAERSEVKFDALTIAWQRQTRRVAEAASGYGEARGALAELNLDVEALNQLAPEDQFEVIAAALGGVANEQDRVRLAMKFWDSEGVQLLQIVNQGTDEIQAMRREARELGLTMDRETAANMAAARDEVTRINAAFSGLTLQLANDFGPTLVNILGFIKDEVVPQFRDLLRTIGLLGDEIDELALTDLIEEESDAIERLDKLRERAERLRGRNTRGQLLPRTVEDIRETEERLKALRARIEELREPSNSSSESSDRLAGSIGSVGAGAFDTAEALAEYIETLRLETETVGLSQEELIRLEAERVKATGATEEQREEIDRLVDAYIEAIDAQEEATRATQEEEEARQAAATRQEQLNGLYAQALATIDPVKAATLEYAAVVRLLAEALAAGDINQEQFNERLEIFRTAFAKTVQDIEGGTRKTSAELEKLRQQADPFAVAWERGIQRLDDAGADFWESFLRNGKFSLESIEDIFLATLAQMIHAATTQRILINFGLGGGGSAGFLAGAGQAAFGPGAALAGAGGLGLVGGLQALGPLGVLIGAGLAPGGLLAGYSGLASGVPGAFGATFGSALSGSGGFLPFLGAAGGVGLLVGGLAAALGAFDDPGQTTPRISVANNQLLQAQDQGFDVAQYLSPFTRRSALGVTVQGQQITEAFSESGREAQAFLDVLVALDQEVANQLALAAPELQAVWRQGIKDVLLGPNGESSTLFEGDFTVEEAAQRRFNQILTGIDPAIAQFVTDLGGSIEEQIANLGVGIRLDAAIRESGVFDSLEGAVAELGEFQLAGENIADTISRVLGSMELLDLAFDSLGVDVENLVELSAEFSAVAGDRATSLWSSFFETFFSAEERASLALDRARDRAGSEFGDIGLDLSGFLGPGGAQAFRSLFESILPELSGDALVQWLEAAEALGVLIEREEQLAIARGETAAATEPLTGGSPVGGGQAPFTFDEFTEARDRYRDFIRDITEETGLLTGAITPLEAEIRSIRREEERRIETANEYARAAGLEGASAEDLAAIHRWAAAQIEDATDRLTETTFAAVIQLGQTFDALGAATGLPNFGGGGFSVVQIGSLIGDASNQAADGLDRIRESIQAFLDGLIFDEQLSPLSIRQRFTEAESSFQAIFAAAQGGDVAALERLPGAFELLLELGSEMFTTASSEYADLFSRRNDIQRLLDDFTIPGADGPLELPDSGPAWLGNFLNGPEWLLPGSGGGFTVPFSFVESGTSFETGTDRVPRDMVANIHAGEMIIDPVSSDVLRRYGIKVAGSGSQDAEVLRQIRDELQAQGTDRQVSSSRLLARIERLVEQAETDAAERRRAEERFTSRKRLGANA